MSAGRDVAGRLRAVRLNEAQRRHFEVLLAMLEETLIELEGLARPVDENRVMGGEHDDVPPEFWVAFEPAAQRIRGRIRALKARLGLEGRRVSRRRRAQAMLLAELVRIEDGGPRRLGAFGAVEEGVAEVIGPELEALHAELAGLASHLAEHRVR